MRLEQIPLFLGVLVAIIGLGLVLDAQLPDGFAPSRERRRRQRAERDRLGETFVGLGVLCMAAALIGRDTWRFGTVAVLLGGVLLAIGGWLNREYLRELLVFRGPARRGEKRTDPARRRATAAAHQALADVAPPTSAAGDIRPSDRAGDTPRPALRADREAPIMTASDGVARGGARPGDDASGDDAPPLRIR